MIDDLITNIERNLISLNSKEINPSGILLNDYDLDNVIDHFSLISITEFEKTEKHETIYLFGLRVYTSKELEIGTFKFCLD